MGNQWDEIYEKEIINAAPARSQGINSWLPRRSADGRYQDAMLEIMEDRYDALMAKNMLEHAGALSMMEAKMGQALPQSRDRFKAIVDVYTAKAVRRIGGR